MPNCRSNDSVSLRSRPPLTLVLGPAGSGKSEWVVSRFLSAPGQTLLLVLSPRQAQTCTETLATRSGLSVEEISRFVLPFRNLASVVHQSAPTDGYRLIGSTFQRLILTDLLPKRLGANDFLGRMRDAPGFITALSERIHEWKLAGVTPATLEAGANAAFCDSEDPSSLVKTKELARLFRAYEEFLANHRLRDAEDYLRLATERIASGAAGLPDNASTVLIDGFYWFNHSQRALLAALAGRGSSCEVTVTLPYDAARPLLFAAPERMLYAFRADFATREITLAPCEEARPPVLMTLERRLFGTGENRVSEEGEREMAKGESPIPDTQRPTPNTENQKPKTKNQNPTPEVQIFDAPNPYVEAEMIARAFRRLYGAGGYRWSDFGIILRTLGDYAPILSAVFERYEIPFGVDGPETLTENPLVKTVLHLLAVLRYGWQREDLLAFLKSSYTATDRIAADALRRRARSVGVRAGREAWLQLVEHEPETPHSVASTLLMLARHDEWLTRERATPRDFADRLRECVAECGLEERIGTGEKTRIARDREAWQTAQEVLYTLGEMAGFAEEPVISFTQFYAQLVAAWSSAVSLASPDGDMVRVLEPYDSRESQLKVAAVMGLTERVFPRRITEDPFLRDEERIALREVSGLELEEQKNRADDERFFFYLAVTAPSERLLLSFPRSSDESDTLPSFYLDEIHAVLPDVEVVSRTLADVAPRPEEAVSEYDRLVAACADLFDPGSESEAAVRQERQRAAASLMVQCLAVSEAQAKVVRSVIASRHLPRLPRLHDAALRADFAGRKTVFSVSELEAYQRCPFQYLLRHVLRLRPEEDDATPRAQGTLLHAILRRYFSELSAQKAALPDAKTLRVELRQLLVETLDTTNLDASPHRLRMTHRMLTDALDGFAERETRFSPQFNMTPTHFELAFGLGAGGAAVLEDEEREASLFDDDGPNLAACDPASWPEPLLLYGKDGGPPVAVCGTIDRVDFDSTGRRALALDYKLGKPPDFSEIQRGLSLQMPLYLLAIERLWGKVGAVGCYDSMREAGRRRFHRTEHVNIRNFAPIIPIENGQTIKPLNRDQYAELTRTAELATVQIARSIETARIEATPGDHCRFCPYNDVCRTTLVGGHDGESHVLS